MHIAICDDDEMSRFLILKLLSEYTSAHQDKCLSFSAFSDSEDLLDAAEKLGGFDIYILDILMPGMDGIELGVRLRELGYDGSIIYLTSSTDFAIDSYKAEASDYILKPVIPDAFLHAFDKVVSSVVEAIAPLLEDKRFSHCSKSLAVNLHNITKIGTEDVTFKDNQTVYFSKKICRDLRTEWSAYWLDEEDKEVFHDRT